jgi:hypothetical protein
MQTQEPLLATAGAFKHWRLTRSGSNAKTPELLRQQAVALIPDYSISQIITALKLNHAQLKRWSQSASPATNFVTLPDVDDKPDPAPINLELCFTSGAQLRLNGAISSTLVCSLVQTLAARS